MKLLLLILVAAACGVGTTTWNKRPLEAQMPLTHWTVWSHRGQVPAVYRHAVDWHAGEWPVYALFSGRYLCVVPPADLRAIAHEGQLVACRWQQPRGS